MSPLLDLSPLPGLIRSAVSWPIIVAVTVLVALTLTGLTARFVTWLGSVRP